MRKAVHRTIFLFIILLVLGVTSAEAIVAIPEFSLSSVVDGTPITSESYKDKVVLITFFATWCKPCMKEIKVLKQLHKELGPRGFSVVALSIDEGGPGMVAKLVELREINYPVAMATRSTVQDFGNFSAVPTSFLVNRKGHVVRSYTGFLPHKRIAKVIEDLL